MGNRKEDVSFEIRVSCGDWIILEERFGVSRCVWLEYGQDENEALLEFHNVERDRILGGDFVEALIVRSKHPQTGELVQEEVPLDLIIDLYPASDIPVLADIDALIDLSLVLKNKDLFMEYTATKRFIQQVCKEVANW